MREYALVKFLNFMPKLIFPPDSSNHATLLDNCSNPPPPTHTHIQFEPFLRLLVLPTVSPHFMFSIWPERVSNSPIIEFLRSLVPVCEGFPTHSGVWEPTVYLGWPYVAPMRLSQKARGGQTETGGFLGSSRLDPSEYPVKALSSHFIGNTVSQFLPRYQ